MDSRSNILIKTPKTEAFRVLFSPQTEIYALSTDKTAIILCDYGNI